MEITRKRTINVKNCYLLAITAIALVSLIGNLFQDRFYNKAIQVQHETIAQITSSEQIDTQLLDNQ